MKKAEYNFWDKLFLLRPD